MAKNILGELENAPGAAARERAHYAREAANAHSTLSAHHSAAAHDLRRQACWAGVAARIETTAAKIGIKVRFG